MQTQPRSDEADGHADKTVDQAQHGLLPGIVRTKSRNDHDESRRNRRRDNVVGLAHQHHDERADANQEG